MQRRLTLADAHRPGNRGTGGTSSLSLLTPFASDTRRPSSPNPPLARRAAAPCDCPSALDGRPSPSPAVERRSGSDSGPPDVDVDEGVERPDTDDDDVLDCLLTCAAPAPAARVELARPGPTLLPSPPSLDDGLGAPPGVGDAARLVPPADADETLSRLGGRIADADADADEADEPIEARSADEREGGRVDC